jgi:hypothetical protein
MVPTSHDQLGNTGRETGCRACNTVRTSAPGRCARPGTAVPKSGCALSSSVTIHNPEPVATDCRSILGVTQSTRPLTTRILDRITFRCDNQDLKRAATPDFVLKLDMAEQVLDPAHSDRYFIGCVKDASGPREGLCPPESGFHLTVSSRLSA